MGRIRAIGCAILASWCCSCGGSSASGPSASPDAAVTPSTPALKVLTKSPVTGVESEASKAFFGDIVVVRISGLAARGKVTLRATSTLRDTVWSSTTTFEANDRGEVDTSRDAATGGYEGVDPDGPMWSMAPTTDVPDEPLADKSVRFDAIVDEVRVARSTLARYLVPEGIERVAVSDNGLVGAYYAPRDGKKHPTILAFGGSEGGLSGGEGAAMYWAGQGYATLGVAYFASPGLPDTLTNVPLEYFEKAMVWLDGRPEADTTKLAVMGGSRGGELALLLGAKFPRLKAVVAKVPSGVVWGSTGSLADEAWTLGGVPLPSVPSSDTAMNERFRDPLDGKLLYATTPKFDAALDEATPEELAAATIHIEKSTGPVMLIAGGDDKLWPSCRLAKIAWDRLGRPRDRNECYPGAGHYIPAPGNPTTQAHRTYHATYKLWFALGGNAKDIARAGRDSDTKLRAFLSDVLK